MLSKISNPKFGKNKGKKYKKVDYNAGTDYTQDCADEFALWYAHNLERIKSKLIYKIKWDDDVAQDTFLKVYDTIRYKGLKFDLDSQWYFLRAYHTNYLQMSQKAKKRNYGDINDELMLEAREDAPTFDPMEELKLTIVAYIDFEYGERDAFIYQTYIENQPLSVSKLAGLLAMQYSAVWRIITGITADVATRFTANGVIR